MMTTLSQLAQGIPASLGIMASALFIAFFLALFFSTILALKIPITAQLINGFTTLFTGTPLLIQLFLIYYGPGQFPSLKTDYPILWSLFSSPYFCAILALSLNSAAYSTVLFKGMIDAIPKEQWQACYVLGMSKWQATRVILPYALKRAIAAYSNEVILVFKATSLVSTITIMDIMGYSQRLFGLSYDFDVYLYAGLIYLVINTIFTVLLRKVEKKMLVFESPS